MARAVTDISLGRRGVIVAGEDVPSSFLNDLGKEEKTDFEYLVREGLVDEAPAARKKPGPKPGPKPRAKPEPESKPELEPKLPAEAESTESAVALSSELRIAAPKRGKAPSDVGRPDR